MTAASAESIARALGGKHAGGGTWLARCVVHDDRSPSLAIRDGRDGKVLVRCHGGCEQADVLAALRTQGLWDGSGSRSEPDRVRTAALLAAERAEAQARTDAALCIWRAARPPARTRTEDYLRSRGLELAGGMPTRLRFAPELWHAPSQRRWPAMVALVTDRADRPIAVHRTFLTRDGRGKAPVSPQKMMLGPVAGGCVRLAPAAERIVVAEGIETALAASELCTEPLPVWAAMSAKGIELLELPELVRSVVIAADPEPAGLHAARAAALRWQHEGRAVRILRPLAGSDFNDTLRAQRAAGESSHANA